VNQLVRGALVVGMVTACTVTGLFDALAALRHAHPGVALTLVEGDSDRLVADVRAGALDLALVGSAPGMPPGLESLPIVRDDLVAAVPPGHELARRRKSGVTLAELADHPVVCMPVGAGLRAALDRSAAAAGRPVPVALQASAPTAVIDLARRGLGVAVLGASMVTPDTGLVAVLLTDAEVPGVLGLVWRPAPPPALQALLGECRLAFAAS
jgi:DNA-binding transcriptional LysR family regulator